MSTPTSTPSRTPREPSPETAAHLTNLRVSTGREDRRVDIVRGVSLRLTRGRVLALVGESGSGKSLTSLAFMGLLPPGLRATTSAAAIGDTDTRDLTPARWRQLRGPRVAMVFQDPSSALNPAFTIGWQIAEPLRRHLGLRGRAARARAVALMEQVGIPDAERRYGAYPHEFSGGMRQRVVIAMALALDPDVLLADEPTTALDVTVQAQILRLLAARQREAGLAMLLVSHDLGVVAKVAQDVAVMYAGRVVEQGPLATVYERPAHPYTRGLMEAVPEAAGPGGRLRSIPGQPPDPRRMPGGCAFHPRCPLATDRCAGEDPAVRELPDGREVACHHAESVLSLAPARPDRDPRPDGTGDRPHDPAGEGAATGPAPASGPPGTGAGPDDPAHRHGRTDG
ncbi:ABC transporter ATP-binding protein [Streptomyces sp. AJS327]|uniref:ABC transporter ATP-binding protein n=1 Tax=Streptomyces sp. AJS327 TaxID=2545265 RepID=UPI001C609B71|nr:ABC transporter ATP-binding protein [Streptomyces sp. AJS327]